MWTSHKVNKNINYNESKYTWGQKADGTWYCKEFKSDTIEEGKADINAINNMLNPFNKKEKVKPEIKSKPKNKIELKQGNINN